MTNVVGSGVGRPETEVSSRATRRRFSAEYKRKILREAAEAKERGELGALLRREGLYSSHLAKWREQAENGEISGLTPKKRGPKPRVVDPRDAHIAKLERELRKQAVRTKQLEALVELQRKVSIVMGITLPNEDEPT